MSKKKICLQQDCKLKKRSCGEWDCWRRLRVYFNSFTMPAFTVNKLGCGYYEGGPSGIRQTVYIRRFISVNSLVKMEGCIKGLVKSLNCSLLLTQTKIICCFWYSPNSLWKRSESEQCLMLEIPPEVRVLDSIPPYLHRFSSRDFTCDECKLCHLLRYASNSLFWDCGHSQFNFWLLMNWSALLSINWYQVNMGPVLPIQILSASTVN